MVVVFVPVSYLIDRLPTSVARDSRHRGGRDARENVERYEPSTEAPYLGGVT